jgi:hypothetical protein
MVKGRAVAKTDPWAYCRNVKCQLHGANQSDELSVDERLAGFKEPIAAASTESTKAKGQAAGAEMGTQADAEAPGSLETVADGTVDDGGNDLATRSKADKPKPKAKPKAKGKGKTAKKDKNPPTNKPKPKAKPKAKDKGKGKTAKVDEPEQTPAEAPVTESEPVPESDVPEVLTDGHSDDFLKAAIRIQGAVADGGPFSKNICDLALSMATKSDGPEAAAKLVEHFDLNTKYGLTAPAA